MTLSSASTRPRLFVDAPLLKGANVDLTANQAHYLRGVLRMAEGDGVRVFNGKDGNWLADISDLGKKKGIVTITEQTHVQRDEPDIWLAFAPIKNARLDVLVEKATELGVGTLIPVLTDRTQSRRVNTDRIRAQVIEAAEQCERMTVPEVRDPMTFGQLLDTWPADRTLWFGDETGGGDPALSAFTTATPTQRHGIFIGPEGGFSPAEVDGLQSSSFSKGVGLGPRVLRAETAVVVALTLLQATIGDGTLHLVR